MIVAIVRFPLPDGMSAEQARASFEASECPVVVDPERITVA